MIHVEEIDRFAWPDDAGLAVWRMHLALPNSVIHGLQVHLSSQEQSTANRFRFERDRLRYTAAHAGMRLILAGYLGCRPEGVAIAPGLHGKPTLAGATGPCAFAFNLSHSGEEALLAVGRQRCIGVDIEQERPMTDLQILAGCVSSAQELAQFAALTPDRQLERFFRIWTCKEAAVKAIGAGLAAPLQDVHIEPVEPAEHARFEAVGPMCGGQRLHGMSFSPAAGYHAAVVTEVAGLQITWHDWPRDRE